jgi:cobaltochelatase CobN
LPGKSIALSSHCYPEVILSAVPNLYPFIVNDPGEGAQAKRRAHAVILDHLTPPLTRAELYGSLERLEMLVDEYYEAQGLDPQRLPIIRDHITALIQSANLTTELNLPSGRAASPLFDFSTLLTHTDAYLCELKEAQIRDGLHIFGSCPPHGQLRDLIIAIARHPSPHRMGLTRAIARERGLDFDPLAIGVLNEELRNNGDSKSIRRAMAQIETDAITLIDHLLAPQSPLPMPYPSPGSPLAHELEWIKTRLIPPLRQTPQEISNLLRGLNGEYIPAGASGAPTGGDQRYYQLVVIFTPLIFEDCPQKVHGMWVVRRRWHWLNGIPKSMENIHELWDYLSGVLPLCALAAMILLRHWH